MLEPNRHPLNGTFELTGRCNLSCKMCLVRVDRKRMAELNLRERTGEEWIDMARQAAAAGNLESAPHWRGAYAPAGFCRDIQRHQ